MNLKYNINIEAKKLALSDWLNDTSGGRKLTHDRFLDSLFELVDTWFLK